MTVDEIVESCGTMVQEGEKLAPLGGFDFSGYNARLQQKYLQWRTSCLERLEQVGPVGFPYKQRILGDKNSGYFYRASALLILNSIRELYEKLKIEPGLAAPADSASLDLPTAGSSAQETGTMRILKPPPKKTAPASSSPAQSAPSLRKRVFVIGDREDPLYVQLLRFLGEIGLEEVEIERQKGQMLELDSIAEQPDVRFAFFVLNAADVGYAMFEIGHFLGKLGKNHVCVLHPADVELTQTMPGVLVKPITVKLEEASFGLLKDLKASGYEISL